MQQDVVKEVQRYIQLASELYAKQFEPIEVLFNLKGRTAGMYRSYYKKSHKTQGKQIAKNYSFAELFFPARHVRKTRIKDQQIRFNPWLFAKYPKDSWSNTIPHEVAHYISDCLFGLNNIKPHGREWQSIMQDFNAEPLVRGDYDLDGIPVRKVQRYSYRCDCREVELTIHRHRKIQQGQQEYRCRDCHATLIFNEPVSS